MTGLGCTTDPVALVPGSVSALADLLWQLRDYADALVTAGDGLARIDTEAGWSGEAADGFREAYHAQPRRWREAGDSFVEAAAAVDRYASTLSWAQARAVEAIELHAQGEQQTAQASSSIPPYDDPGEACREAARELLQHAPRPAS